VGAPRSAQFVGFDSAWAGNSKRLGAICSISFSGEEFFDFKEPEPVGFTGASDYIVSIRRPEMPTLIALDQPTIVPNPTGMRPVEKVVASLISWMGGGVQPANLGRTVFLVRTHRFGNSYVVLRRQRTRRQRARPIREST
jgi:predicted RNase H-like nuclease